MASPVIRARIAPVALLIALAFVIVGFLRADREMTTADGNRAQLTVSETATLVEAFMLEHLVQLHSIERSLNTHPAQLGLYVDTLQHAGEPLLPSRMQFDQLWVVDSNRSTRVIRESTRSQSGRISLATAEAISRDTVRTEPILLVLGESGSKVLVFIEPFHRRSVPGAIGVISTDTLIALLGRQHEPGTFHIVITAGADTVVSTPALMPNKQVRRLDQLIRMPFEARWNVAMTYTPSGRGVRIALWVVGLGAIIGLGIGLILERREASRIADRSSELEHLSTELLRANRAKSEFLANVSHELRTPLNAIVGFVDLLRDGVYGPLNSRQTGPVERIEASANHLRHLVDQVLDLAKMAAGRLEVHTEPIELRPFVFDVVSEVEPLMTEKGLGFSLAVGASLPRVRTDPTHLRQILINLLGNAVKFTANGGISVRGKLVKRNSQRYELASQTASTDLPSSSYKTETPWIALQVADSGIGIPEKDRERIFDEFEQVNAGPRGDSMRRGTGLGLSISRRLARLLGGDITVESELGRGSIFTVWLPVDPADLREDQAA